MTQGKYTINFTGDEDTKIIEAKDIPADFDFMQLAAVHHLIIKRLGNQVKRLEKHGANLLVYWEAIPTFATIRKVTIVWETVSGRSYESIEHFDNNDKKIDINWNSEQLHLMQ